MHIPVTSILLMSVSAVLSIGVPIALFLVFRKKFNFKILPMIFGIIGFTLFALVLESTIHSLVIGKIIIKESQPLLFIVYAVFMAGIFEESARLIAFLILKKKYSGIGTGLSYGIGHGGTESILLAGVSLIFTIVMSILINTGNINLLTGKLSGTALTAMNAQITQLTTTAPYLFLVSGLERMIAIAIQLSLSVVMFYAVFGNKKLWLYPAAIICHAIIDTPAASMQAGLLKSIPLVEILALVCAVLMVILAWFIHRSFREP